VPGWHARTESYRKAGKIKVLGIIQEQHPDRCRLFMQWHQMDWPILVDSLNLLEVAAVPYTLLIDEMGVVHEINPSSEEFETFLSSSIPQTEKTEAKMTPATSKPDWSELKRKAEGLNNVEAWSEYAQALFLWGGEERVADSVDAFELASSKAPDDGWLHFRLGVAYRRLFDLSQSNMLEFKKAIEQWQAALDLDPNQYIWRRRIQQYGPRLDKPYSFYDWVNQAREEITARGEKPHPLRVEPGGAEFAYPSNGKTDSTELHVEPDQKGRVFRDVESAIQIESTTIAATYADKKAMRVHLRFQPNPALAFHWNNEAKPLAIWVQSDSGWEMESQFITVPNPQAAIDEAPRSIEFELIQNETEPMMKVTGYALYYICEEVNGTCLFRRQDFTVDLGRP